MVKLAVAAQSSATSRQMSSRCRRKPVASRTTGVRVKGRDAVSLESSANAEPFRRPAPRAFGWHGACDVTDSPRFYRSVRQLEMKPCNCTERHIAKRVVLTGGPGAGKTIAGFDHRRSGQSGQLR